MKKALLLVLLTTACGKNPKFKEDTCFRSGLFEVLQILEIKENNYIVKIVSFVELKRQFSFEEFEQRIEKEGLLAESCDHYRDAGESE